MSVKETHTTPSEPDAVGRDLNMGITSNQLFTNPFLIHFLVRHSYKSGKTLLVIHVFPSHLMYSRQNKLFSTDMLFTLFKKLGEINESEKI